MFLLTRGSDQINAYLNQRPTMSFYDKAFLKKTVRNPELCACSE